MRLFATQHLAKLSRETELAQLWQISLLLTQLYDTSIEVCELAVQVLEVACQSMSTLELVVDMRPSLHHLGDIGAKLLTRYVDYAHPSRSLLTPFGCPDFSRQLRGSIT